MWNHPNSLNWISWNYLFVLLTYDLLMKRENVVSERLLIMICLITLSESLNLSIDCLTLVIRVGDGFSFVVEIFRAPIFMLLLCHNNFHLRVRFFFWNIRDYSRHTTYNCERVFFDMLVCTLCNIVWSRFHFKSFYLVLPW